MTKEELIKQLEPTHEPIEIRKGLDDGLLIISTDSVHFVAQRMGQWKKLDTWSRPSIQRVHVKESFMGQELSFSSTDGQVNFKKIPKDIDIVQLLGGGQGTTRTPQQSVAETTASEVTTPAEDYSLRSNSLEERAQKRAAAPDPVRPSPPPRVRPQTDNNRSQRDDAQRQRERAQEQLKQQLRNLSGPKAPVQSTSAESASNPIGKIVFYLVMFFFCSGFIGAC